MTQAAQTARAIRQDLKIKFPGINFRVRSENFAGGNSVDVDYDNFLPTQEIEKVIKKYQYGHFDGMIDLYEYSNSRDDIPQVKYVMVDRHITSDVYAQTKTDLAQRWGIKNEDDEQEWYSKSGEWSNTRVYQELRNKILK